MTHIVGGGTDDYGELVGTFELCKLGEAIGSYYYEGIASCGFDKDGNPIDSISTMIIGDSIGVAEISADDAAQKNLLDNPLTYSNGLTLCIQIDAESGEPSIWINWEGDEPDAYCGEEVTFYCKRKA